MQTTHSRTDAPTESEILAQVGTRGTTGVRRVLRTGGLALLVLGVLVALVLGVRARSAQAPMSFITTDVLRTDLAATVTATGTLRGKDTVSVGAETSGRVKTVMADYNDEVKAGQVLAEIDPAPLQAALNQASAQLVAARADVKNKDATAVEAKLNAERTRALAADGLASKQALEAAVAAADRAIAASEAARAQVTVAEATVQSNLTSLAKTQIHSPIDGVVLSRDVEPGQALAVAMTTPVLFKVAKDLREMEVTISIDEADVGRTRAGQQATFTVDAFPSRKFSGQLHSIHNVAVTKDNVVTYEALLRVGNDDLLLRPGMTATVSISTDQRSGVLTVPNAALRFSPPSTEKRSMFNGPPGEGATLVNDGRAHVWVLKDGKPSQLAVEVGLTDGVKTEVSSPTLSPGDQVITDVKQETKS